MTNPLLTLDNIRSGAAPSDAVAVGFLLGEIERLQRELYLLRNSRDNLADNVDRLSAEPGAYCPNCDCDYCGSVQGRLQRAALGSVEGWQVRTHKASCAMLQVLGSTSEALCDCGAMKSNPAHAPGCAYLTDPSFDCTCGL